MRGPSSPPANRTRTKRSLRALRPTRCSTACHGAACTWCHPTGSRGPDPDPARPKFRPEHSCVVRGAPIRAGMRRAPALTLTLTFVVILAGLTACVPPTDTDAAAKKPAPTTTRPAPTTTAPTTTRPAPTTTAPTTTAPTTTAPPTTTTTRPAPAATRPFSATSPWNTPLGTGTAWRDEPGLRADHWWVNRESYSI